MTGAKLAKQVEHTPSSGNVFADLGLPDADEHLAKAEMAVKIARLLEWRKLTQKALADQPARPLQSVFAATNEKFSIHEGFLPVGPFAVNNPG